MAEERGDGGARLFRQRGWWIALPLAFLGAAMVFFMTRYGPGASGDSSSYLMGAQNLLAGHGFYRFSGGFALKPITGFPPGFSLALAAASLANHDLYAAARLLNALLMGANLVLVAWLIRRTTRSWAAAGVGQLLVLMSSTQVTLHAWVMSEPLYIFTSLLVLGGLAFLLEKPAFWKLALVAAITAAAILTRYAGLSLVVVAVFALAFLRAAPIRQRMAEAAAFLVISLGPFLLWTQRNAALAGTRVDRQLAFHAIPADLVRLFMAEVSSWFVPHEVPLPTAVRAGLAVVIAVGLIGLFVWISRKSLVWHGSNLQLALPPALGTSLPWLILLYLAAYAAVLVSNSAFLDASTTASAPARYLAPVYVALVVVGVDAAHALLRQARRPAIGVAAAAGYALILLAYNVGPTWSALADPLPSIGYTARRVTWADSVDLIKGYEGRAPVVSNNPEMVYILTGEPAYVRPISYDQYQQTPRADYQVELAATKQLLLSGSVLVVIKPLEQDDRTLIDYAGLVDIGETDNVRFYAAPQAP